MRIARLAAAVVFLAQAMPASAGMFSGMADMKKPNMKIGQLELHPYYGLTTTYDDNIYRVPPNENGFAVAGGGKVGSMILTNNVGLNLMLPMGSNQKISAGYDFRSDIYRAQSSANNAISQKANFGYDWKGSMMTAKVWDSYENTQDPAFNPNSTTVIGELVQRQRRWQNTAGIAAEYALGDKFFFGADGQDMVQHYLDRTLAGILNRSEATFGVKTGYKVQPKTRVFAAIHRGLTHYNAGTAAQHVANSRQWLGDFGIEGVLSPKITGQIQTGMAYRQLDKDNAAAQQHPISRNWTTSVMLDFKPGARTSFMLNGNRSVNDAVSGGNFFISSGVGLTASHKVTDKVMIGGRAGVQSDKYSESQTLGGITAQRRDETYRYGVSTDYHIQEWLSTGVAYEHTRRHSIFSRQFNYKDSLTSWNLKVTF